MATFVEGQGPLDAAIMLIGEAPGRTEDELGQPFCGDAGQLLNTWWAGYGVHRRNIRIDNIYPYRPPDNDLSEVPKDELDRWIADLHHRIAQLKDPYVLVPAGNYALRALTDKDKITKWRGSILSYTDLNGREIKVIPTIHPAATFRQASLTKRCILDWGRIFSDAKFKELRLPVREHVIHPTKAQIIEMYELCKEECLKQEFPALACDIETPGGLMGCVGFSWRKDLSITIPVDDKDYWPNAKDREWSLRMVEAFLKLPFPKLFQGGLYDNYWLKLYRVKVVNWIYDTICEHHCLDSTEAHKLEYMASIDTREPYWKDEAKDPDEIKKYTRDMNRFWTYNGKDVAVDRELHDVYWERICKQDKETFYYQHYTNMLQPLLAMMLNGVKMDDRQRRKKLAELMIECYDIQDALTEIAGEKLHAKKSLSTAKIKKFLYEKLDLPKMINRKTGELTTSEIALRRLLIRLKKRVSSQQLLIKSQGVAAHPVLSDRTKNKIVIDLGAYQTGIKALELLLTYRRKYQLSLFLPEARLDDDDRMRTQYNFSTETGRLSSSKNPTRSGGNIQNIDREIRDIFLPDEGCIFLEVDLSQVEWRIMAMLTRDPAMIALARSSPVDFDIHNHNGGIVFRCDSSKITKDQRYLAKRAVHASSYGMRGQKLSEVLLLDGYVRDPYECQAMLDIYLDSYPGITLWQNRIAARIRETRQLTNSWDRTIVFKHDPLNDDLFRRGYAFIPQSDAAALLNQYGLIPMHKYLLKNRGIRARINAHIHDALLISVHPEDAFPVAEFLVNSLQRPRLYEGEELAVPATVKLGTNWKGDHEFKTLPSQAEFDAKAWEIYSKLPLAA